MNLGGLIGELRMQLAEAKGECGQGKRKSRKEQVFELLAVHGSIACRDDVAGCGITSTNAAVLLNAMHAAGELRREGEMRHYRYLLP